MLKVLSAAPVCGTAQLSLSMSRVFCIDLCGEAPGERSPREVRIAEQQQWLCLEGRI